MVLVSIRIIINVINLFELRLLVTTTKVMPTILIVDDDVVDRMTLKRVCSNVDANLVEATSGIDALAKVEQLSHLALIFLDVRMPKMNGFEVAEKLRDLPQTLHTPIIFITASIHDEANSTKGYSAGAVDFISKPIKADILLSKVRVFLDLWQLRAELESVSAAKSQFFSYMSHEIRTPMNGVLGIAQRLKETNLDSNQLHYVTTIVNSGQLLLTIINDILAFSQLEVGQVELESIAFDLKLLAQEVIQLLAVNKQNDDVKLVLNYAENMPCEFIGDPTRISQILINLVSNALKFTEIGSVQVTVTVEVVDGNTAKIKISVSDTGIGIVDAQLVQIFSSFTQADTSVNRTHGGSGLGLAICKMLVKLMDGQIDVCSQVGKGSVFSVNLALPMSMTVNSAACDKPVQKSPDVDARPFTGQVLLVEDTDFNQMITMAMLKQLGVTPTLAEDGLQGVEAWRASNFDLILMDNNMPVMSGLEATRLIRSEELASNRIPIVGQTADANEEFKQQSRVAGMDEVIVKPYGIKELTAILSKWL